MFNGTTNIIWGFFYCSFKQLNLVVARDLIYLSIARCTNVYASLITIVPERRNVVYLDVYIFVVIQVG